ncbi:MAG: hypothetical protein L0G70_02785 [Rubrobacter sp.]|nr:hypothetical protein [Rubrobacter sp.]
MKYTVTSELDPDLYDELERERHTAGLSRSAAMRQGVEWWIAQRKEHGEERIGRHEKQHRQIMRRFDYVVGMIREQERKLGISGQDATAGDGDSPATNQADETNGHSAEHVQIANPEEGGVHAQLDSQPQESSLARARKRTGRRM